jgi:hypothetical protein
MACAALNRRLEALADAVNDGGIATALIESAGRVIFSRSKRCCERLG